MVSDQEHLTHWHQQIQHTFKTSLTKRRRYNRRCESVHMVKQDLLWEWAGRKSIEADLSQTLGQMNRISRHQLLRRQVGGRHHWWSSWSWWCDIHNDECGQTGCFLPSGFPGFRYRIFSDTWLCRMIQLPSSSSSNIFCKTYFDNVERLLKKCKTATTRQMFDNKFIFHTPVLH